MPNRKHWALITNPAAAQGRNLGIAAVAVEFLREQGIAVELLVTTGRGHAFELAQKAIDAEVGCIVMCGGDGTINEVLPALTASATTLGVLPFGTANDFARGLGIPRRLRPALNNLVAGNETVVDLGIEKKRLFCTVAAYGFDAEISQAMSEGLLPFAGTPGYLYATIRHLYAFKPPRTVINGDFGRIEGEVLLVATAITRSYGGGMKIAPQADPTDGKFDVVVINRTAKVTILKMLPTLFWGGHINHPAVRVERSASLSIETDGVARILHADGEPLTTTPAVLQTLPRSLRVIIPKATFPLGNKNRKFGE